jgi:hypothetical protein
VGVGESMFKKSGFRYCINTQLTVDDLWIKLAYQ